MAEGMKTSVGRDDVDEGNERMLPIYRQLSLKNGQINKLTKEQLKQQLSELLLDTRGVKEVLKKRLKNFYRKREMAKAKVQGPGNTLPSYDFIAVIDFEATCEENNPSNFKHEIIEFPIVLVDTAQQTVVSEFHCYVKPVINPVLSDFCTQLTGISQDRVRNCDAFPAVLEQVHTWMKEHNLGGADHKFAVLTDGPWDVARFLHIQCLSAGVALPRWAQQWINIRKAFSNFYGFPRCKLTVMLQHLGMTFQGNQHSGIDDARNIARIAMHMLKDGCDLQINERIFRDKLRKHSLGFGDIEHVQKQHQYRTNDISEEKLDESKEEYATAEAVRSLASLSLEDSGQGDSLWNPPRRRDDILSGQHCDSENNQSSDDCDDLLSYYALQHF